MDYIPYVAGLLIAVSVIYLLIQLMRRYRRSNNIESTSFVAHSEITKNWELTGRINVMGPSTVMDNDNEDIPATFHLQVEETRYANDIGGGAYVEYRWRLPTRKEVKDIVRLYNARSKNESSTFPSLLSNVTNPDDAAQQLHAA
jgi:hypothetical protein